MTPLGLRSPYETFLKGGYASTTRTEKSDYIFLLGMVLHEESSLTRSSCPRENVHLLECFGGEVTRYL